MGAGEEEVSIALAIEPIELLCDTEYEIVDENSGRNEVEEIEDGEEEVFIALELAELLSDGKYESAYGRPGRDEVEEEEGVSIALDVELAKLLFDDKDETEDE